MEFLDQDVFEEKTEVIIGIQNRFCWETTAKEIQRIKHMIFFQNTTVSNQEIHVRIKHVLHIWRGWWSFGFLQSGPYMESWARGQNSQPGENLYSQFVLGERTGTLFQLCKTQTVNKIETLSKFGFVFYPLSSYWKIIGFVLPLRQQILWNGGPVLYLQSYLPKVITVQWRCVTIERIQLWLTSEKYQYYLKSILKVV